MGRPINKRYIGNVSLAGQQIEATAYFGGDSQTRTAYIVSQKGTNTYYMKDVTGAYSGRVKLVDGNANLAQGQANVTVTPFGSTGSGASATANIGIFSDTIVSAGSGDTTHYFVPGEVLHPSSGTSTATANLHVDSVTLGLAAIGGTGGSGYTVGDQFVWNYAGYNTPAILTVASTTGNGNVASLTYTAGGSVSNIQVANNTPYSTATTANAGATGATFTVRWDINQVSILNHGDYSSAPANPVALTGSTHGTGATINATWDVSSVYLTNGGINYQAVNVTFGSGNAKAIGVVNAAGSVSSVQVNAPGNGLTSSGTSVSITPIRGTEYARVIKNRSVETWEGNEYEWVDSATTPVDGQAQIRTA